MSITVNENIIQLFQQNKLDECIKNCQAIINEDNCHEPQIYNICAAALQKQNKITEAIDLMQLASKKFPKDDLIVFNLANLYMTINDFANALENYKKTLKINPKRYLALNEIGLIMVQLNHHLMALEYFELSLKYNDQQHFTYNNLANIYRDYKQDFDKAILYYKKALSIDTNYMDAVYNLANTLMVKRDYHEASKYFAMGIDSKVRNKFLPGYVILKNYICDWQNLEELTTELIQYLKNNLSQGAYIEPFFTIILGIDEKLQQQIIQNYTKQNLYSFEMQGKAFYDQKIFQKHKRNKNSKIRIGYVSSDFYDHPTTHLMNSMLQHHDRNKYEIYVYSLIKDDGSEYRENIMSQADHFCDLAKFGQQVANIAKRINQDQIDILLDVKGYTLFSSPEIFALKPAPVQINYLAYPATMGADFMDYIIADKTVITKASAKYYNEKTLTMNGSYFVTDENMGNKIKAKSRDEYGLPKGKIILGSFNQVYKIDQEIFNIWLDILNENKNSILWLYAEQGLARDNLTKYIEQNYPNIKEQIIFADKVSKNEHLARIKNVDLMLDCQKCNGHTTTIDALSVGVPVVTIKGNNMAQKGAASILSTYGLKELIAKDIKQYKKIIMQYISKRTELRELKNNVKSMRKNNYLFDTKNYVKRLEKLFANIELKQ